MTASPHAITAARRLAAASPQAMLPCPACAVSVRAENLDKHLHGVHALASIAPPAGAIVLRGKDRWIGRVLIVLFVLSLIGASIWLGRHGGRIEASELSILTLPGVLFALATLAAFGVFPARLELDEAGVRLRCGVGLRTRRLALPVEIELGSLYERQAAAGMHQHDHAHTDVDIGDFLRMRAGRRRITVGCKGSTGARRHWHDAGWSPANRTRWIDVMVDREAMIALEYALASRALLRPRVDAATR